MGLNRYDVIKQINNYSYENNQKGLIHLLCEMLDNIEFKNNNLDLIHMIISIGELYGYYSYINYNKKNLCYSEEMRREMYKSHDSEIYYNSGQLSLLNDMKVNKKMFISAPTTFGKTKLVLEYLFSEYKSISNILFIIPTNSLSEEIYIKLLLFNHSIDSKYFISTNPKIRGKNNILILTPEKYLLLLESKNIKFDVCVMDESYKIEEENDKSNEYDPLNSRSSKFRRIMEIIAKNDSKVFYLSPYTYITDDSMDRFLNKYNIKKINRDETYVNKNLFCVSDNDEYKNVMNGKKKGFHKSTSGVDKASFIIDELKDNTIVYVRYPKDAYDFLTKINNQIDENNFSERFNKFIKHIENNYEFDDSKWYILDGLKKGIGIYVSPTPRYIKREIINLFNSGNLKILVVTSAFAEGVNSSAKNIIITNDVLGSNTKMTALDLLNLSGRAGRFGIHSQGNIYSVKKEIHDRLKDCQDKGVKISNLNYESGDLTKTRRLYDIETIEDNYLTMNEMLLKKEVNELQTSMELNDDDLNIALSISKNDKLKLYKYFMDLGENLNVDKRIQVIKNITSNERNDVVNSIQFVFDEIKEAQILIYKDDGDIPPYSKNGTFLWGKFYGIHSSGSIKEILKSRKKYIENELQNDIFSNKTWLNDFITDGKVDNFKLYNQAFKFISNIIEYRIPFYVGFYVSVFYLFCRKKGVIDMEYYDVIEISKSLEKKKIDEKYEPLLEYGFSIDTIKKIQEGDDSPKLLDDFENVMYEEFLNLTIDKNV